MKAAALIYLFDTDHGEFLRDWSPDWWVADWHYDKGEFLRKREQGPVPLFQIPADQPAWLSKYLVLYAQGVEAEQRLAAYSEDEFQAVDPDASWTEAGPYLFRVDGAMGRVLYGARDTIALALYPGVISVARRAGSPWEMPRVSRFERIGL